MALLILFLSGVRVANGQNLLTNPHFDAGLDGWRIQTYYYPQPGAGSIESSATWFAEDASSLPTSGSALLHALATTRQTTADVSLAQCVPVGEGALASFGARIKTLQQLGANAEVTLESFDSPDCTGPTLGISLISTLPRDYLHQSSSEGLWLPASGKALVGRARSLRLALDTRASVPSGYFRAFADALFDDAYLTLQSAQTSSWIVPSVASVPVPGSAGHYWRTTLTVTNPDTSDAVVTLKFLGHDVDGRSGRERTLNIGARRLVTIEDVVDTLFGPDNNYGGLLITSSTPTLAVQSETSTGLPQGGVVGEAALAVAPTDYVGSTPRLLAPIRESVLYRTNVIFVNATEVGVIAHVSLRNADGALLGTMDVDLPPLGMTQVNRIAEQMGVEALAEGWLEAATSTPGGSFVMYASVINNRTNDPRFVFPR